MEGNNHYNYYALQFIPDDKDIYTASEFAKGNLQWNGKNTWKSWHLIPSSRPVINPPTIKANYIDIPGGNGTIDASSILTTYPVYNDREGQIEYYVTRNYPKYDSWTRVYHDVLNYLGGRVFKVILEEEPSYYYRGRVNVNQWKSEKDWSKITLDYHLEPFKYEVLSSTEPWLWDPFSFIDGIITPEQKIFPGEDPRTIYDNFVISGSNREHITVRNYNDGNPIYGAKMEIIPGTAPFSPTFSIRCDTNIVSGNHTWMHVLQVRQYSNHLEKISETELKFTDNTMMTKRFYDMTFYEKDYDEFIFFETPANYQFTVTVNFRRGWL